MLKTNSAGIVSRYARSFYLLLSNRRKFERLPMSGTVRATWGGYAVSNSHVCSCVDASPRGMGIDCPSSVDPETVIALHTDESTAKRQARVCYCQQRGDVYRIGLEFKVEGDQPGTVAPPD
jgi:hypothetical protein